MRRAPKKRPGSLSRLAAGAVAVAVLVAALGWAPTRRLAGDAGVTAMLVALGINLAASLAAALPVARAARRRGAGVGTERVGTEAGGAAARERAARGIVAALGATAIRFLAVAGASVAAAVAGTVPTAPLLVWAALGYLALLAVDTGWAVAALGAVGGGTQGGATQSGGTEERRTHPGGLGPAGSTETR